MDLSKARIQNTAEMRVRMDGELTDIKITLMGHNHPERVAFERRMGNRDMRAVKKSGKPGDALPDDVDDLFDQGTERLAALTVGWENLQMEGADVPFSRTKAAEIYGNRDFLWLRSQVIAFLGSEESFLLKRSPASAPA